MDKNIKKLISEAFNELYDEMVNEAPASTEKPKIKHTISDNQIESIINKAKTTGRGLSYDDTANESSQNNFNIIIDNLVSDYKNSESPTREMSKRAIQSAFAPRKGNKIYRLAGNKYITDPNLEDAINSAYEQIFINNFDGALTSNYDTASRGFSALAANALANRVQDYIIKGQGGKDFKAGDVMSGGRYNKQNAGPTKSTDDDYGDNMKFGDTFAAPDAKDDKFSQSKRDSQTKVQKEMWNDLKDWVDGNKERMSEKTYIAISGLLSGMPSKEFPNQYPNFNWLGGNNVPTIIFKNFATGTLGQEASNFISNTYNTEFNLASIDPLDLEQMSSQSPEFGNISKKSERMSGDMNEIYQDIKEYLKQFLPASKTILNNANAGYFIGQIPSSNEIESTAKKMFNKPFHKLSAEQKGEARNNSGWKNLRKLFNNIDQEDVNNIKDLIERLKIAEGKSKSEGGYGSQLTNIEIDPQETLTNFMNKRGVDPSEYENWQISGTSALDKIASEHGFSEKDKDLMMDYAKEVQKYTYGGMFEGVKESDVEKLMERVLRRISK